jgi:hypothetical protein
MLAFLIYLNTERSDKKIIGVVAYTFILGFATFMYFFPVLILIAIVFYSKKYTDTLIKGLISIIILFIFIFMFHFSGIWNLINPNSAIGSGSTSVFSFIRIFGVLTRSSNISLNFEYIFIPLVIFIAILFSYFKIPIYLELSLTFTVLFFMIQIYAVDEYFWVFPFYLISLAHLTESKGLIKKLLLLQIYFIPLAIIFNVYAGRVGMGTGIFYLSYPIFHNSTYVLFMIPNPILVTRVLDGLSSLSMTISLFYIFYMFFKSNIWMDRDKNPQEIVENTNLITDIKTDRRLCNFKHSFFSDKKVTIRKITFIMVLFLLLTLPLYPLLSESQLKGSGVPIGIFIPCPTILNSTFTYKTINHDKSVVISPTNEVYGPFFFERNLSGEQLSLKMNISVYKTNEVLFNTTVLQLPGISVTSFSQINLSGLSERSPNDTHNVGLQENLSSYLWGGGEIQFHSLNGSSDICYNNISHLINNGLSLNFLFKQTKVLPHQNILLRIKNGNQTIDVSEYDNSFYYAMSPSFGIWTSQESKIPAVQEYSLANFVDRNGYLYFNVNGYYIGKFALVNRTGPIELYFGKFGNSNNYNNYSFYGKVSNMFYNRLGIKTKASFLIMSNNSTSCLVSNRNAVNLNIQYTQSFSSVNNITAMHNYKEISNPSIYFGRISYSPFYLNFSVNSFVLLTQNRNFILSISILIDYSIPSIIIIIYYFDYRRNPH